MKPFTFLSSKRICYILVVSLFLTNSSCSKDSELESQIIQNPLIKAKADFSNALSLWNQPEYFDRSSGNTETELLQHRLGLVYDASKNLLMASGHDEESLKTISKEKALLLALKAYTQKN